MQEQCTICDYGQFHSFICEKKKDFSYKSGENKTLWYIYWFTIISPVSYTPILLYLDDSCTVEFTYHVNFHAQRQIAIVYVSSKSQTLNSTENFAKRKESL